MPSLEELDQHLLAIYDNAWRVTAETLQKEGFLQTQDDLESNPLVRSEFMRKLEEYLNKIKRDDASAGYSLNQPDVALSLLKTQGRLGQAVIDYQKRPDTNNTLDDRCASAEDYAAAKLAILNAMPAAMRAASATAASAASAAAEDNDDEYYAPAAAAPTAAFAAASAAAAAPITSNAKVLKDLEQKNDTGKNPLFQAFMDGDVPKVDRILQQLSSQDRLRFLKETDVLGQPALGSSIRGNQAAMYETVLGYLEPDQIVELLKQPHVRTGNQPVYHLAYYDVKELALMFEHLPMETRAEIVALKKNDNDNVLLCALNGMVDNTSVNEKDHIKLFLKALPANALIEALLSKDNNDKSVIDKLHNAHLDGVWSVLFQKVQAGPVSEKNLNDFLENIPKEALIEISLNEHGRALVNFLGGLSEQQRAMMLDKQLDRHSKLRDYLEDYAEIKQWSSSQAATAVAPAAAFAAASASATATPAVANESPTKRLSRELDELQFSGAAAASSSSATQLSAVDEFKSAVTELQRELVNSDSVYVKPMKKVLNEILGYIQEGHYTKDETSAYTNALVTQKQMYQNHVPSDNVEVMSKFENAISKAKKFEADVKNDTPTPGMP